MKLILLIVTIATLNFNCYSQSIERLEENRGFKEIKLGKSIDEFERFVKKDSTNIKYFGAMGYDADYAFDIPNSDYEKIGESEVFKIFVKVYENKIFEINIIFEKSPEIIELLNIAYGKMTMGNNETKSLIWETKNIRCWYMEFYEKDFAQISYTDFNLRNKFEKNKKANKKKKAFSNF